MPRVGDFYFCWKPAGMILQCVTDFKDILGWDQVQARGFEAVCRHTALAALAQLRHAAIRNALCGGITVTASSQEEEKTEQEHEIAADLGIPLGDAPVPSRPGQPCPSGIAAIKLTIAETARLVRLARQHAAGLISDARLGLHLRWSRWRRRHQARARWHHYSARLAAAAT
jgi:hypothetical protein